MSSDVHETYHRAIYGEMAGAVVEHQLDAPEATDVALLREWDVFHLHWPEWFLGPDVERHRAAIDALRSARVGIVWTQHNLIPHSKDPRFEAVYREWAVAADAIVHHSEWGRERVLARRPHNRHAVHRVIPHVHFGPVSRRARGQTLRLGVVGAPRAEKDLQLVLDAVAAARREDLRLSVFAVGDENVPDDPRIEAVPYERVPRAEYDDRLARLDLLVMPFGDGGDMLTTGTVGDAVGAGIPTLVSDWTFLHETLGAAAIPFGRTRADLTATLERLTDAALERAAAAAVALRKGRSPARVAAAHRPLLELAASRH